MKIWMTAVLWLVIVPSCALAQAADVHLVLDTSEAESALRILDAEALGKQPGNDAWQHLFASAPYQWLKLREAEFGRGFTDEDFRAFLAKPETVGKRTEWAATLAGMKRANMTQIGVGVLEWLPAQAQIEARVFPMVKPRTNSFVWKKQGEGPAIFLYMQQETQAQFENTVAHECHHIGLQSLSAQQNKVTIGLPENVQRTMSWMSAFGEGEAMLVAAGSVDRHPHWPDDAAARARWDGDMMHFNADLAAIGVLLQDILDGKLKTDAQIRQSAAPFWGNAQGAWYTVGYEMAVLVEREFGRQAFDQCLLDPRQLLVKYNEVAKKANAKGATLAVWSDSLLKELAPIASS